MVGQSTRGRGGRLAFLRRPAALVAVAIALSHCGSEATRATDPRYTADASVTGADPFGPVDASPASVCDAGWPCQVDGACSTPTTLTGRVFDPAGVNPLANAIVFVPDDPGNLAPIAAGSPACSNSIPIVNYVAATITDARGSFTLTDVPTGSGVPVTVQIGKWRRTAFVDVPRDCGANQVADGVLRLPRSRAEGEMPQMALLAGGGDNIACFVLGMGIDATEFDAPGGPGRVHVYRGVGGANLAAGTAGDCTGSTCPLWDSPSSLDAYDVALLGCEGAENLQTKSPADIQSMHDWLVGGGKLFGVHSQDAWLSQGPADFQRLATWVDGGASGASGPFRVNTAFPFGLLLQEWAETTGAADAGGGVALAPSDVATSVSSVTTPALAWIYDESTALAGASPSAGNVKALSATLPAPADAAVESLGCGRVTLTDIHPGGTGVLSPVPSACPAGGLSAEEKILEFLFFQQNTALYQTGCEACPPPPPPPPAP
jgi:hypothetical protein